LNATPRTTWESMIDIPEDEIDDELINELICQKSDRISYVAAPRNPLAGDSFTPDFWRVVLAKIKTHSRFLVFDTAHDFSDTTISVLTNVQNVLLVVTPDMASLRAAVSALEVYDKIGVRSNQVKLVLNHTNNIAGIRTSQLEKVFGREIDYVLPYEPREVFRAINFGEPFILSRPDLPISKAIEDMAFDLSDNSYKNIPPASPSAAWKRVNERLGK
jgi:pilus assembly protein CpaE